MLSILGASVWFAVANAHLAAWHKGMFCLNGTNNGQVDLNTAAPVTPLYQLAQSDWWFHRINGCDRVPPAPGDFLDIPAGGQFQVEIASNRAKTTLSYNGGETSDWPDGGHYPDNYNMPNCITSPNIHAQNETMASGTAFAISYVSDINLVRPDNLVVFSVKYHTPWKRVTTYSVPPAMPACPPDGCICAWGWIPNGCGQANMYHQAFRCRVTGASSTTPVATPKPPVWCEDKPETCVKGAKQMLYWHQKDGNNIQVSGLDLAGQPKSPGYNMKCGFSDGAQNDIFERSPSGPSQFSAHPPAEVPSVPSQSSAAPAASQPAASSAHSRSVASSGSPAPSRPPVYSVPSWPDSPRATAHSASSQPSLPSQPAGQNAPSQAAAHSQPSQVSCMKQERLHKKKRLHVRSYY